MRIRTLLVGYVLVQGVVFAVAGAVVYAGFHDVGEALRLKNAATEVARGAFELSILTDDYLLGKGERPRQQWARKHGSLGRLLANADGAITGGFDTVRQDHATLGRQFDRLVDVDVRSREGMPEDVAAQLQRRLAIQLSATSQSMFLGAERISSLAHGRVEAGTANVRTVLMITAGSALVLVVGLFALLAYRINRSLESIGAGIDGYARGELDHRIALRGRDEMGTIASALNDMAASLQDSTARLVDSRNRLAQEVANRKRAEHEIALKNDALARSNQDLQQFAYVASHDLQEPLRAVSSYADLLQKRYGDVLDERAQKYVRHCVEGSRRMSTMIEALLAFSRVTTRGRPFEPVETTEVLDAALFNLDSAIRESGAMIQTDALPRVVADREQLVRLFQNLIGNAIKFRNEAKPAVEVGAERADHAWEFSVRDNGIGIDPEHAERIFVIFQRLHGRDEHPGSGIGLAICKRIVERHGGTIRVVSEPGQGADFRFTIPDTKREPDDAATE